MYLGCVPIVGEHAFIGCQIPFSDGHVGRARKDVSVIDGHTSNVALMAAENRNDSSNFKPSIDNNY